MMVDVVRSNPVMKRIQDYQRGTGWRGFHRFVRIEERIDFSSISGQHHSCEPWTDLPTGHRPVLIS